MRLAVQLHRARRRLGRAIGIAVAFAAVRRLLRPGTGLVVATAASVAVAIAIVLTALPSYRAPLAHEGVEGVDAFSRVRAPNSGAVKAPTRQASSPTHHHDPPRGEGRREYVARVDAVDIHGQRYSAIRVRQSDEGDDYALCIKNAPVEPCLVNYNELPVDPPSLPPPPVPSV